MSEAQGAAAPDPDRNWFARIIGILLGLIGLWLAGGGAWLLWLGGSAYYLLAGIGCLIAARFYVSGKPNSGFWTYLAVFAGTCIWARAERTSSISVVTQFISRIERASISSAP